MNFLEMRPAVEALLPGAAAETHETQRECVVTVEPTRWVETVQRLRDDPALRFDHLSSLTAVDEIAQGRFAIVAHLWSYPFRHALTVKTRVPRDAARLDTLTGLYRSADWMEREVYDLFGVAFAGHPDLRRLMMPEDYPKHPLRKDFTDDGFVPKPG